MSSHRREMNQINKTLWRRKRPPTLYAILFLSSYSSVSLFVALVSSHWLITREKTIMPNGTFAYLKTWSGLWRKCSFEMTQSDGLMDCSYIDHFTSTDRDELGATDSIHLSLRKAVFFYFTCFALSLAGTTTITMAALKHGKLRLKSTPLFAATGILHIIAGLFLLTGLVIYLGAITDEAADRSKSIDPSDEQLPFKFNYGYSLMLVISTFFSGELVGVLSVEFHFSMKRLDDSGIVEPDENVTDVNQISDIENPPNIFTSAEGGRRGIATNEGRKYTIPHKTHSVYSFGNKKRTIIDPVSERSPMFDTKEIDHRIPSTFQCEIISEIGNRQTSSEGGLLSCPDTFPASRASTYTMRRMVVAEENCSRGLEIKFESMREPKFHGDQSSKNVVPGAAMFIGNVDFTERATQTSTTHQRNKVRWDNIQSLTAASRVEDSGRIFNSSIREKRDSLQKNISNRNTAL